MIPTSRTYRRAALAVLLGVAANLALAAPGDDFVDQASANGMAEIETARMALEKSKADDIRAFAQRMLDDHSKSRQELAQLAKAENLPLSDDVTLMNKAKALILQLRDGDEASVALNFFASKPGMFTANVYEKALGFAAAAHNTLHLSVRLDTAQSRADNLEAAMQSRTAINLACGVIMAQNRCSQAEAMDILTKVSSNRNRKLRDVAAELIEQLSGDSVQTHFDA